MGFRARKAVVTLDGVELSAKQAISWKLTQGVAPYQTIVQVHRDIWKSRLSKRIGEDLTLEIINSQNASQKIRGVYILHIVPSDSPYRVSFIISDRRWKWPYKIISRSYNITRRSGNRSVLYPTVPVENQVTVDQYTYKAYSLDNGATTKWTAQRIIEDMLDQATDDGGNRWFEESFPVEATLSVQNLKIDDSADVAVARALAFTPGLMIYCDIDGLIRTIDASDLDATEKHFNSLPPSTYQGDHWAFIDRKAIRPARVLVHFARQLECRFKFSDDWSGSTSSPPNRNDPFLENVMRTVDPVTKVTRFDPEIGASITGPVPMGTWVEVRALLDAWNDDKPEGSLPWTFDTIKRHWLKGDLEGVLGGGGSRGVPDLDPSGNIQLRVSEIRQSFRQVFRINRRYMERVDSLQAVRVGPWDPATGATAMSPVWGQACIIPSVKGQRMAGMKSDDNNYVFRNVDYTPENPELKGKELREITPGPARVNVIDRDQGIFQVTWVASPYGTVDSIVPCNLQDSTGKVSSVSRNLKDQDKKPMGAGIQVAGGTNGIFLAKKMHMQCILTIVPGAPNNKGKYHQEPVMAADVLKQFKTKLRIEDGDGPDLEIYVPPGESSARFQWNEDEPADVEIVRILGLDSDSPNDAGLPSGTRQLVGFTWTNEVSEVKPYAIAQATEAMAAFADQVAGRIKTRMPRDSLVLRGNMAGASIDVAAAPSAQVSSTHEFPGFSRPTSRLAFAPSVVRQIVQGIIPFGKGDK